MRAKAAPTANEHEIQSAYFQWVDLMALRDERYTLIHAIPNGGQRHIAVAMKLKEEGVRPGVPDVCVPLPSQFCSGLYIEFKAGKNKPTPEQDKWINRLKRANWRVFVCYSADEAIEKTQNHMAVVGLNAEWHLCPQ